MPKYRMKATMTGTHDGVDWPARGEEVELSKDEAESLLNAGIVGPVDDKPEPEAAVLKTTPKK